jgi:hypothetical protein
MLHADASSSLATAQTEWPHLPPPMGGPNGLRSGLWRLPPHGPVGEEGGGSARPARGYGSGARVPGLVSRNADRHRRGLLARATSVAALGARLAPITGARSGLLGNARRGPRPPASRRAHPRPQAVVRARGTDPSAAPSGSRGPGGALGRHLVARSAGTWWPDPAWTRPGARHKPRRNPSPRGGARRGKPQARTPGGARRGSQTGPPAAVGAGRSLLAPRAATGSKARTAQGSARRAGQAAASWQILAAARKALVASGGWLGRLGFGKP